MHLETPSLVTIGAVSDAWAEQVLFMSEFFDPFDWWEVNKANFTLIYPVAVLYMMIPDSNGYQERLFSGGQWIDDKLRTSQSDATFEMKSVMHANRQYSDFFDSNMEEHHREKERQATAKVLATAAEWKQAAKQSRAEAQENNIDSDSDSASGGDEDGDLEGCLADAEWEREQQQELEEAEEKAKAKAAEATSD